MERSEQKWKSKFRNEWVKKGMGVNIDIAVTVKET